MGPLGDLLSQLDPAPDRRGRQFERICQWGSLTHDPVYAHETVPRFGVGYLGSGQ